MDQIICRLCGEKIGVTSIFKSKDSAGIWLSEKVNYCAKVTAVEGDGLPSNICLCCEEQLTSTYSFVLKCEETDKKLKSNKQEREIKYELKSENFADAPSPDNTFDDSDDLPLCRHKKTEVVVKTKRKYIRSNVKKENLKKVSKCAVCGRLCSTPSSLSIHMRCHTNEKPYACHSCDKRYKDQGTLKRHIERNHDDNRSRSFICEHCGKGFYTKFDCKIHKRIHTGETPYICSQCPARFSQIGTLQRHILTHTGERSYMCAICPKMFPTKEQLNKHCLVHSDEKKYKCPVCEILFKSKNNMNKHIKMHTEGMSRKFTCNYCNQSFCFKGNLQLHINNRHSEKSGYCVQCEKFASNIEVHMWKHAGVRPVMCEFCPSSFYDAKGLAIHVNFRHKANDKYKCTINDCNLTFPSHPMLEYHVMRYHKSIKPFPCDRCPRRFYRKSDMARHKKGTHKEYRVY